MKTIKQFLENECTHAGWRFWLLFVIMTNIGFFLGLGLEQWLFGKVNVYIATTLSGIGQAWVLSRHFPERGQWAIASALLAYRRLVEPACIGDSYSRYFIYVEFVSLSDYCGRRDGVSTVACFKTVFAPRGLVVDSGQRNWASNTISRHGDGGCSCMVDE